MTWKVRGLRRRPETTHSSVSVWAAEPAVRTTPGSKYQVPAGPRPRDVHLLHGRGQRWLRSAA
jgi:hypothetical protein